MKVCVISSTVFAVPVQGYAGLEHLAWQQARGLAELGHEVSLVAPDGSTCPGVTVIPCGPAGKIDEKRAYGKYWEHLLGVDCVISNDWQKWAYMLKQEGRLKAPVLGVTHAPVNTMMGSPPPVEKPCITCISQDQANHYEALFGGKARVAYNGIDTGHYRPMGIPRSDRFLFLARFSSVKGPHVVIQSCLEAGVGLDLIGDTTITGEPEYFHKCVQLAEQTSPNWNPAKGKQIRIVGGVSRGECVWWYSQARALLHGNQTFREPFGLAPVESLACGAPVIAFDYGALRETVKHGVTGLLVNSAREFTDAVRCEWMANIVQSDRDYCTEWAGRFTVENMIKRYDELIREAVETGGW